MTEKPFLTDIKTLRERARQHIEQGAVTPGYSANRETVVNLLNEALATEIVCVECGGTAHLISFLPEEGVEPGDALAYRCADCNDRFDVVWEEDEG
jgi:hypothetical protein